MAAIQQILFASSTFPLALFVSISLTLTGAALLAIALVVFLVTLHFFSDYVITGGGFLASLVLTLMAALGVWGDILNKHANCCAIITPVGQMLTTRSLYFQESFHIRFGAFAIARTTVIATSCYNVRLIARPSAETNKPTALTPPARFKQSTWAKPQMIEKSTRDAMARQTIVRKGSRTFPSSPCTVDGGVTSEHTKLRLHNEGCVVPGKK